MADAIDIDLYDNIEDEFSQDADFGSGGDLYDDVITASSNRSSNPEPLEQSPSTPGSKPPSRQNSTSMPLSTSAANHTGKKHMLYIGNLTWWTTDQDLLDAMSSIGVSDLLDLKFYENRANGQSKGFALIIVGSEQSSRALFDRLPRKELHGQVPQVSHFTKQALSQFEAQARKTAGGGPGGDGSNRDERGPTPRGDNASNGNFRNGEDKRGPPPGVPGPIPGGFPPRMGGPPPRPGAPGGPVQGPPPPQRGAAPLNFARGPRPGPPNQGPPPQRGATPVNFAQLVRACTDYLSTAPPGSLPPVTGPPPGMPPIGMRPGQPGNRGPPPRVEPPRMGVPPPHMRGPPPSVSTRAPPPIRPEWDAQGRPPFPGGPSPQGKDFLRGPPPGSIGGVKSQYPPGGLPPQSVAPPGVRPPHIPGVPPPGIPPVSTSLPSHVPPPGHNPYYPPPVSGPPPTASAHPSSDPYGRPPPPSSSYSDPYSRPPPDRPPSPEVRKPSMRTESSAPQISDQEFEEIFQRNKTVSSSAINRAVQDASSGDFPSAIETLVTAISLIKQSKIASDDRCKILISSLQDTLHGIEEKSYGGQRSRQRSRSRDRERERERVERRPRHRSRSRERERDPREYRERSRERERHYDERRERDRERERSERSDRGERERERERSERERGERERGERERGERERGERERAERERGDRERADRERAERERGDREREYSSGRRH